VVVILHKLSTAAMTISTEVRVFFVALGERIASRLQWQMEAVSQLPETQQCFVSRMLDTMLTQAQH
jgi:hypothetical protein